MITIRKIDVTNQVEFIAEKQADGYNFHLRCICGTLYKDWGDHAYYDNLGAWFGCTNPECLAKLCIITEGIDPVKVIQFIEEKP